MYVSFRICDVEQRQINVYFDVDLNNIRQRRNNVDIFNVNFRNVGQRRKNVVNMTICKNNKQKTSSQKRNNVFEFQIKIIQSEYSELKIFFTLMPISRIHVDEYLQIRKNS